LVQAGFKQWFIQHPWSNDIEFEDSITMYVVERILPWLVKRLQEERERDLKRSNLSLTTESIE
jgi:hypothetical protein